MTSKGAQGWIDATVENLFQRKIDTIVTDGITGRAVPHPISALVDLSNAYFRKLRDLGLASKDDLVPNAPVADPDEHRWLAGMARDNKGWLTGNQDAFNWLQKKAADGLAGLALPAPERVLVQRIASTCGELLPIVAKLEQQHKGRFTRLGAEPPPSLDLTGSEHATLSKAWELGTNVVAMQTIVMLDGDLITRIAAQYTGDSHAVVRQIHREAVEVSLSTWALLAKTVGGLAEVLFKRGG